jgi:hypothetical protein
MARGAFPLMTVCFDPGKPRFQPRPALAFARHTSSPAVFAGRGAAGFEILAYI